MWASDEDTNILQDNPRSWGARVCNVSRVDTPFSKSCCKVGILGHSSCSKLGALVSVLYWEIARTVEIETQKRPTERLQRDLHTDGKETYIETQKKST